MRGSKLFKAVLALVLALSMLSVFTACAPEAANPAPPAGGEQPAGNDGDSNAAAPSDELSQVNLVYYSVGDMNEDESGFINGLNELLLRDINATIEFRYLSWGEVFEKYPLVLSGGEVFDGIYVAEWLDFTSHTQKGAFLDITDMLPVYAPGLMEYVREEDWPSATQKGRIYAIPCDGTNEVCTDGIIYREDLRVEYGIPEIKHVEDFEAFMLAIQENEPEMRPVSLNSVTGSAFYWLGLFERTGYDDIEGTLYNGFVYPRDDQNPTMTLLCETPEYKDMIELMAKWQGFGFWNTNDMTNPHYSYNPDENDFGYGLTALWAETADMLGDTVEWFEEMEEDWEIGFWGPVSPNGNVNKYSPLEGGGVSIMRNSPNPERALMAVDLMLTNRDYRMALSLGVEGVHYILHEDWGFLAPDYPDGGGSGVSHFMHSFSWMGYGGELFDWPEGDFDYVIEHLRSIAKPATLHGFVFDSSSVVAEVTAINDVMAEYGVPLSWGFVTRSIDEDIATLIIQLEAAGARKVQEELQRQVNEFVAG